MINEKVSKFENHERLRLGRMEKTMNKISIPLGKIADAVGGRLQGDGDTPIENVAPFFTATETDIVFAGGKKFLTRLDETRAGAVIVPHHFQGDRENLVFVGHPQIAFNQVIRMFYPEETREWQE